MVKKESLNLFKKLDMIIDYQKKVFAAILFSGRLFWKGSKNNRGLVFLKSDRLKSSREKIV
jgi:hypothetical protein